MQTTNEPRKPTEAQIKANRENARKSTGPRTAEGKAASSRNRLLHGLRANKHILLDEDPEGFLILLRDLYDRFNPIGDGEEKLVQRIANDQWRLDRILPAEAGIYRDRLHDIALKDAARQQYYEQQKSNGEKYGDPVPPPPARPVEGDLLARAFNLDCEGANSFAKLARYETTIERSIDRCLRLLEKYQVARAASGTGPDEPLGPEAPEVAPVKPAASPDQFVEPPAEPAVTPLNSANCHLNPKNEGIPQTATAAFFLVMCALGGLTRANAKASAGVAWRASNFARSRLSKRPAALPSTLPSAQTDPLPRFRIY
jgi:hypothetical protein